MSKSMRMVDWTVVANWNAKMVPQAVSVVVLHIAVMIIDVNI